MPDTIMGPAIQKHLNEDVSIHRYIRASILYFNRMSEIENIGNICGYGDKVRFKNYNIECSPKDFLNSSVVE